MVTIGPYYVSDFINTSSSGNNFRCVNNKSGEAFTCKIVDYKQLKQSKKIEQFSSELELHSKLENPWISRLIDIQLDDNYVYIILENNSGMNLEQMLQQSGPLPEAKAATFFKQIMEGISYIHTLGIAHRDINLKNIIITPDGYAKLNDFGLCKYQEHNTYLSTTCGTFVYVPPEILLQQKYDGLKADIWSAGICLYAMVANHLPWLEDDQTEKEKIWEETLKQICSGDIDYDESLQSDMLRDLLQQMLCVDPEYRIEAEEILCHPWLSIAEDYQEPKIHSQESHVPNTIKNFINFLKR